MKEFPVPSANTTCWACAQYELLIMEASRKTTGATIHQFKTVVGILHNAIQLSEGILSSADQLSKYPDLTANYKQQNQANIDKCVNVLTQFSVSGNPEHLQLSLKIIQ